MNKLFFQGFDCNPAITAADKALVPEALHKKLFVKKEAVKADVVVEQQGNAWRIVYVEKII